MKYCTNCGSELQDGAKACGYCGMMINEISSNNENVENIRNNTNTSNMTNNQSAPTNKTTNGLAVAGFVVSLVSSLCCCGAFNLISLVLSIIGLVQSKKLNGSGKGMAIAGIIISSIMMVISVILTILGYGATIFEELS